MPTLPLYFGSHRAAMLVIVVARSYFGSYAMPVSPEVYGTV